MRICFVGPASSSHMEKWCGWFGEHGHEVHLISFTQGRLENTRVHVIDIGIDVQGSDIRKIKYLFAGKQIRRLIERIRPDVINVHYATSYGTAVAFSGVRGYILSVWGSDIYDFPRKSKVHKWLLKYSLHKAEYLFSTSNAMADETRKYTQKKIVITPFGVDMELFNPNKRIRKKDNRFVVGIIKTLSDLYGIEYLIKAAAIIRERRPDINLEVRIAGEGPARKQYESLTEDLQLNSTIVFLGRIDQNEAAYELANMDVAVFPSTEYESFGVAAIEAQASGIPVIVSDCSGLKEVSNPGKTCLVVKKRDEFEIAKNLLFLFEHPNERIEMGTEGRKNVEQRYELKKCFSIVEERYRLVLESN